MIDRRNGPPGRSRLSHLGPTVLVFSLVVAACGSDLPQSSLNPKAVEAEKIDQLWLLVFWAATVIFVAVMTAMTISLIRFRKRSDDQPEPKQVHGNTKLEIVWTIVPAVILALMAVPTVRTLFELRTPDADPFMTVRVTGHQWWWEFEYLDYTDSDGRMLTTANELHIPAGVTTNLQMTSVDVIHSFWVPPLNGKRDLVPGKVTELTLTPDDSIAGEVIPGQCAEFCWLGHADMRMKVVVETEADFDAWAGEQLEPATVPASGAELAGYETFTQTCTVCHQANVDDGGSVSVIGAALAPDLTHFGSRLTLGAGVLENTPEHLAQWIDNPSALKAMDPSLNDLAEGLILGMPDYGLDEGQIAELTLLLQGWK